MEKVPFIPQIENVKILDYPVKAGSGNWGISADVLGEHKIATIGLISENAWRMASEEEKPVIAMGIAVRTFKSELLKHLNYDTKKVQSESELMYHLWDSTGRQAQGEPWDILVNDKKYFPDNDETEIVFDVHDGFAVGQYQGKEYLMTYPTKYEVMLNEKMRQNIENYIGHAVTASGIIPADIALTRGKIIAAKPLQIDWQTQKGIHQNANFKPNATFQAILEDAGYSLDMNLPLNEDGTIQKGFMMWDDDNCITWFRAAEPGTPDYDSFYSQKATDDKNSLTTMLDLYQNWKTKICETRISDLVIRQAPNDPSKYFISCKVDGEQQVSQKLNTRDTDLYRQMQDNKKRYGNNSHDMAYEKELVNGFAVHYFRNAISNDRSRQQGLKR